MISLLIAVIYAAFISLGLPDSLLGSAWPVMHLDLGVSVSLAGLVSMIITVGTIISSLASDALTRRFGAGLVTAVSVLTTALSLFLFAIAPSYVFLCIAAVPYGLGAGAIDAALNNYVALHFSARHMSWLHCFWGVGASISPYIMGACLEGPGWRWGYGTISVIQIVLTFFIFISLPLWKKSGEQEKDTESNALSLFGAVKIPGVLCMLLAFLFYCSAEMTSMLWSSTYLVSARGVEPEIAARFASLFFLGMTFGRLASGFLTAKFSDKKLIRMGLLISVAGAMMIALPLKSPSLALAGLVVVGLGCAPVYPSIIHSTPENFGRENSQAIIGIQMASAYTGSTLMPSVFGFLSEHLSLSIFPYFLIFFIILTLIMTEKLNRDVAKNKNGAYNNN